METKLILKFLSGSISEEELQELKNWIDSNPDNRRLFESHVKTSFGLNYIFEDSDLEEEYNRIHEAMRPSRSNRQKGKLMSLNKVWLKYAAVFIGILSLGYMGYISGIWQNQEQNLDTSTQITLQLGDGTIQILDEKASQIIKVNSGKSVVNQKRNVLFYTDSLAVENRVKEIAYNQLAVPYGKKFQLVLADGTHIFLNSGSTLKYPTRFHPDNPRDVFLDGEAFFSVTKNDKLPFRVITDKTNTVVTGTKFNVSSYTEDNNTSTVLVEGSVYVEDSNQTTNVYIEPGQRATFNNDNILVDEVNIEKHIAWTRNQLYFVDDRFELIIKKLERHFNVSINSDYTTLNNTLFSGNFETETFEQILNTFRKHTSFEYERNGNEILIKSNNNQ